MCTRAYLFGTPVYSINGKTPLLQKELLVLWTNWYKISIGLSKILAPKRPQACTWTMTEFDDDKPYARSMLTQIADAHCTTIKDIKTNIPCSIGQPFHKMYTGRQDCNVVGDIQDVVMVYLKDRWDGPCWCMADYYGLSGVGDQGSEYGWCLRYLLVDR